MQKRVLVAEESDTIRGVAETILRQHGYDVISVGSSDRALELLEFSLPHLILVSADLKGSDGRPCYEKIQANARTTSVPLLLLAGDESTDDLPFPPEAIIPRPFDPNQLVQRVSVFADKAEQATANGNAQGENGLDDELLDAALGLDEIDVTSSEVINKSVRARQSASDSGEVGKTGDKDTGGTKVESLMIQDEDSEIKHQADQAKKKKAQASSKLEIMDDQYGLSDPSAFETDQESQAHDYDWFVNSMRAENDPAHTPASKHDDIDELTFTETSAHVDPVTPGPSHGTSTGRSSGPMSPSARQTAGVDKFIDEFKKEIEKIRADDQEVAVEDEGGTQVAVDEQDLVWEEKVEKIKPEHMEIFTREFVSRLAEKLAEQIAAKIDGDKLLQMIKNEIVGRSSKKS